MKDKKFSRISLTSSLGGLGLIAVSIIVSAVLSLPDNSPFVPLFGSMLTIGILLLALSAFMSMIAFSRREPGWMKLSGWIVMAVLLLWFMVSPALTGVV